MSINLDRILTLQKAFDNNNEIEQTQWQQEIDDPNNPISKT